MYFDTFCSVAFCICLYSTFQAVFAKIEEKRIAKKKKKKEQEEKKAKEKKETEGEKEKETSGLNFFKSLSSKLTNLVDNIKKKEEVYISKS